MSLLRRSLFLFSLVPVAFAGLACSSGDDAGGAGGDTTGATTDSASGDAVSGAPDNANGGGDTGGTPTADPGAGGGDTATAPDAVTPTDGGDTFSPVGGCDPISGSGCDDPTTHCAYDANNEKTCATSGNKQPGEACGGADRCAVGECYDLGAGFLCHAYCETAEHCGDDEECATLGNAPFKLCAPRAERAACHLLQQDCAGENEACFFVESEGAPVCFTTNNKAEGEACEFANDCAAGLVCVNDACHPLCGTEGAPACADATASCQNFYSEQQAGVCIPPAQ